MFTLSFPSLSISRNVSSEAEERELQQAMSVQGCILQLFSWRQTEHQNNGMLDEQQQKNMLNHQWNDEMLTG